MCVPSSGPSWKTLSSCWFGARAAPDPLYQKVMPFERFGMLRQHLNACNTSWPWVSNARTRVRNSTKLRKAQLSPKTKSFVLLRTGFLPTAIHRNSHSIFYSIFGINTSRYLLLWNGSLQWSTKKPPTSLSFLTIIILLIYFTRLQLKSFKYKLFFLYRKCNKVKIVPCVIHSIIAMLTKFCIECARIDVIWYKKALYFPTQPHTYIN